MTLPDPLTGELALSERGEYFHHEAPGTCGVCDDIITAFRLPGYTTGMLAWAVEHVRLCPVALAACERGRAQLLAKADAGELHIPVSWIDETIKMIETSKQENEEYKNGTKN